MRQRIRVLHLIGRLGSGGPSRSLLTAASATQAVGELEHSIVSLRPADPPVAAKARSLGLELHVEPSRSRVRAVAARADIVQVHFWNNPPIYRLLGSQLPDTRLLLWSKVSGEHPPQVLPPELLDYPDLVLASCAHSTTLPGLSHLDYIPAVGGWDRVERPAPRPPHPFTIGWVGKLDFSRVHPDFISMCARVRIPDVRFIVCGDGAALPTLRRQAAEAGVEDRIEFRGFVEDIGSAIREFDVLGYPLCPLSYAASELALQEAMYAGVPPVVLGPDAVRRLVDHGETGLTTRTDSEYVRALAHLYRHPAERTRLGRAARQHAVRNWSPESVAASWARTYERLMRDPKHPRPPYRLARRGAVRFADSVGHAARPFRASLSCTEEESLEAERQIAGSPSVLCTADGGIVDYRDAYPGDPHLRLWSGLIMYRQGRRALAAGEFAAAIRLGLDHSRVRSYLALAAEFGHTHHPGVGQAIESVLMG